MTPVFANRYHVYVGPDIVQVVFICQLAGEDQKVAHVALSRTDAAELRDLLAKLLQTGEA